MSRESFSQLTTKDVSVLMTILERCKDLEGPSAVLLRDKLNYATVYFRDDIPANVVTLNSRVIYRVNGHLKGPHVVVQSEGKDFPDYALSIHTLHGLGLLGLAEGETTTIEHSDGRNDTIFIETLVFQPEADLRNRDRRTERPIFREQDAVDRAPQIVHFRPRSVAANREGSDDDDPGPFAA